MKKIFDSELVSGLKHETPYFLFSKQAIADKVREFKTHFPDAHIYYAMKANSEHEVLRTVHAEGCGFEIASVFELRILKELGIPAQNILYGTSVKPLAHIKECFEYGVDLFAFDSLSELEKIAAVAPGVRVYARLTVDDTGSVFRFSEKFGTEKENIVPLLLRAQELNLQPYGVSFHVGSQASNPDAWMNAFTELVPLLSDLKDKGIPAHIINSGGGFPCTYSLADDTLSLKDIAQSIHQAREHLPYPTGLILEPGRGLIADAGILVTTVIARVERKEATWLFLDAGVYNALYESLAFQGSTRYHVTSMRPSYNAGEKRFALAGPTGDSVDVITREALLPQDIGVGDTLVFHAVGAYSLVVTSRFNGFPKPDVYFI